MFPRKLRRVKGSALRSSHEDVRRQVDAGDRSAKAARADDQISNSVLEEHGIEAKGNAWAGCEVEAWSGTGRKRS